MWFKSRQKGWLFRVTLIQSRSGFKTGAGRCIGVQFVLVFVVVVIWFTCSFHLPPGIALRKVQGLAVPL